MTDKPIELTYDEPAFGGEAAVVIRLEQIYGAFPRVTTTPTWTPKKLQDSFALNTSTGKLYYYDFTNSVWKNVGSANRNVVSITTAASYTINTDTYNALSITALAGAINTIAVSGTPSDFDSLIVRIKDNGGSQNITWSASFASYGSTLPTATTAGKILTVGFLYDSVAAKWGCVAVQTQP